jgi:endonuclease/exonuclease/phosphatase family metal-dependent hydrolase
MRLAVLPILALSAVAGADISVRIATFNIQNFDPTDATQFNAAVAILQRIGADVVCVQEIDNSTDLTQLASASGYPHAYLASASAAIDSALHAGVLSKYPLSWTATRTSPDLSGDPSAKDLTRNFVAAAVAVPGAAEDLIIISNHWKAASGDVNEFRRSVESIRAMQTTEGYDSQEIPYLIMGDMNDNLGSSHTPDPFTAQWYSQNASQFPMTYQLGNDVVFPVDNGTFRPLQNGAGDQNLTVVYAAQKDGKTATMVSSSSRLDYIWRSDAVSVSGAEIYDSRDEGLSGGLPKTGSALPYGTSGDASDHLTVFADVTINDAGPTGACCINGGCDDTLTEVECLALGGEYRGDDVACGTEQPPCPEPTGACCMPAGGCDDTQTETECSAQGGTWRGDWVLCGEEDPQCPGPPGVCCVDGGCDDTVDEPQCAAAGGDFRGPGTVCEEEDPPCPGPTGACCVYGGCDDAVDQGDCLALGGQYRGDGVDCGTEDPPCPVDSNGACCTACGCEQDVNEAGCLALGGEFRGIGVACGLEVPPCPPPSNSFVINEVMIEPLGADETEFVEIRGSPLSPLCGLTLLVIEGETLSKGRVDLAIPLDDCGGQPCALNPDGYFVAGGFSYLVEADLVINSGIDIFEAGTQTLMLVRDCLVGTGDDIDALPPFGGGDGVADVDVGTVLDAMGIVDADYPDSDAVYYGDPAVGPDGSGVPPGGARCPDGADGSGPADWVLLSEDPQGGDGRAPMTPGARNPGCQGDYDGDGDVDLSDFAQFQECFREPAAPMTAGCHAGDMNADGALDLADLSALVIRLEAI